MTVIIGIMQTLLLLIVFGFLGALLGRKHMQLQLQWLYIIGCITAVVIGIAIWLAVSNVFITPWLLVMGLIGLLIGSFIGKLTLH